MSSNITLSKNFEIELEDNTIINVTVCVEASTEDEFQASDHIKRFTYENVLDPLEEVLTELLSEIKDEADDYGEAASPAIDEILTADDYPDCAE
jgi:hypothetical protein